jgi:hypothetical protein
MREVIPTLSAVLHPERDTDTDSPQNANDSIENRPPKNQGE